MEDQSDRVFRMRPLEKADLEVISPWFQEIEDLGRFDRTSRVPLNLAQTEDAWRDAFNPSGNSGKCWFVVQSESGEILGMSGLEAISPINRDAVIAMFVAKSARRLGLGIRATALLGDFAFRQLGLNRLTSYYRQDNTISRDLVERMGCQVEGVLRQAWYSDGTFHDMVVVGLLRQDWMDRRLTLAKELKSDTVVTFGSYGCPLWSWPPQVDKFD
ncbi:GNAT family N-acetyltransferase [Ruegeria profundi]|uniref:GNAT family N-acetyltransferase n=1 Tax=Ruegeria profundi TaxID=1685378 RepID=UPI001CD31EEC|nr:GNAT family protein [Ruegeria profundi]MCA0928196.1 GNAT family N-acetyltransferase [Ruegeria profundi]